MTVTIQKYLNLLTSEHNQKPNFVSYVSALCQPFVDIQNLLATFPFIFDVDNAVGDQLDKVGQWVGVSRRLNQAINFTSYQLASDTFVRPNENPLNPALWTVPAGSGLGPLQIVDNVCVATSLVDADAEGFTGVVFPNNQYSEFTAGGINPTGGSSSVLSTSVRQNGLDGYYCDLTGPLGVAAEIALTKNFGAGFSTLATFSGTVNAGDRVRITVVGTAISITVNGVVVITATDSDLTAGIPALGINEADDLSLTFVTNYSAGAAFSTGTPFSILPDDAYRILIKLFIAMNVWDGTVPGMYSVWDTVFGVEGYQILVQDNQDMTMGIVFIDVPTDPVILAILTQGYFLLRPAGVLITGFYMPSVPGVPIFGYDIENATVSGFDVGAWMVEIEV